MALHTELPIYKPAVELLSLAFAAQANMHRSMKRTLGERICVHCVDMIDLMALANAGQGLARVNAIDEMLRHQRTLNALMRVAHESRQLSHTAWANSIELLDSVGKQSNGWRRSALSRSGPAA
jgi:hypothetical protein